MNRIIACLLIVVPFFTCSNEFRFESGSYRHKLDLRISSDNLELKEIFGSEEQVKIICNRNIAKGTIDNVEATLNEFGILKWNREYLDLNKKDGESFSLYFDNSIESFRVIGYEILAPKEFKLLIKYLNELLTINGCEHSI